MFEVIFQIWHRNLPEITYYLFSVSYLVSGRNFSKLLFKIIDFQPPNLEQFCRMTNKEGAVQLLCYKFDIVQSICNISG